MVGDGTKVELWGYTAEYTTPYFEDKTVEWRGDWIPNNYFPYEGGDIENVGDDGHARETPGFEIILVFFVITLVLFWKRK